MLTACQLHGHVSCRKTVWWIKEFYRADHRWMSSCSWNEGVRDTLSLIPPQYLKTKAVGCPWNVLQVYMNMQKWWANYFGNKIDVYTTLERTVCICVLRSLGRASMHRAPAEKEGFLAQITVCYHDADFVRTRLMLSMVWYLTRPGLPTDTARPRRCRPEAENYHWFIDPLVLKGEYPQPVRRPSSDEHADDLWRRDLPRHHQR